MIDKIKLTNLIRGIGVPAHIKGYKYLQDAVEIMEKDSTVSITKELYPQVAEINNSTPTRVERAIRHAIGMSWDPNNNLIIKIFVNPPVKRPVVSHYIAILADTLGKGMY